MEAAEADEAAACAGAALLVTRNVTPPAEPTPLTIAAPGVPAAEEPSAPAPAPAVPAALAVPLAPVTVAVAAAPLAALGTACSVPAAADAAALIESAGGDADAEADAEAEGAGAQAPAPAAEAAEKGGERREDRRGGAEWACAVLPPAPLASAKCTLFVDELQRKESPN